MTFRPSVVASFLFRLLCLSVALLPGWRLGARYLGSREIAIVVPRGSWLRDHLSLYCPPSLAPGFAGTPALTQMFGLCLAYALSLQFASFPHIHRPLDQVQKKCLGHACPEPKKPFHCQAIAPLVPCLFAVMSPLSSTVQAAVGVG